MRAIAQDVGSLVFEGVDEESNDYRLEGRSAWISVGNLTVYVHRTLEGVAVGIYPRNNEADIPALASCEAAFAGVTCPLDCEVPEVSVDATSSD